MRPSFNLLPAALVAAALSLVQTGEAQAGDCTQVKFQFKNNLPVKIKVVAIRIVGNQGEWREDIGNTVIVPNYFHTTNARRLNKLDSGARPTRMTVEFEEHIPQANSWRNRTTRVFANQPVCKDGIVYLMNINPPPQ